MYTIGQKAESNLHKYDELVHFWITCYARVIFVWCEIRSLHPVRRKLSGRFGLAKLDPRVASGHVCPRRGFAGRIAAASACLLCCLLLPQIGAATAAARHILNACTVVCCQQALLIFLFFFAFYGLLLVPQGARREHVPKIRGGSRPEPPRARAEPTLLHRAQHAHLDQRGEGKARLAAVAVAVAVADAVVGWRTMFR